MGGSARRDGFFPWREFLHFEPVACAPSGSHRRDALYQGTTFSRAIKGQQHLGFSPC